MESTLSLNVRSEAMRIKSRKLYANAGAGKLVKGLLLGSVVGAAVGWLTGERNSIRQKLKTAEDNIESQARELAEEGNRDTFPTAG